MHYNNYALIKNINYFDPNVYLATSCLPVEADTMAASSKKNVGMMESKVCCNWLLLRL